MFKSNNPTSNWYFSYPLKLNLTKQHLEICAPKCLTSYQDLKYITALISLASIFFSTSQLENKSSVIWIVALRASAPIKRKRISWLIVPTSFEGVGGGGTIYPNDFFFRSVNFDRSIYSSYREVSGRLNWTNFEGQNVALRLRQCFLVSYKWNLVCCLYLLFFL